CTRAQTSSRSSIRMRRRIAPSPRSARYAPRSTGSRHRPGVRRCDLRPLLLEQHATQDLADQGLGKLVAKLDLAGDPVSAQPLLGIAGPRDDLVGRGPLALLQDDVGLHALA